MSRLLAIFLFSLPMLVRAATVTSSVTHDDIFVGRPFLFQIHVDGTTNVMAPRDLGLDDFQTINAGTSTQVRVINGRMSASRVIQYTLVPRAEGTFEIPPVEVTVDGEKVTTEPHSVTVGPGSQYPQRNVPTMPPSGQRPQQSQAQPVEDGEIAYAELIIPKKSIYVGELVPVEIRYYFRADHDFSRNQRSPYPEFGGEGFTIADITEGKLSQEEIDGATYHVLPFKTAITAVKSGKLEIPEASLLMQVHLPSESPQDVDSLFAQFFGRNMMETRELEVRSEPVRIDVKPLPREGKPENFSGAIGEFTIAAEASPDTAGPGEPINLSVAVTGRGNFDGMGEPTLGKTEGWKEYPATSQFEGTDDVGYSGTKTFTFPLVAQTAQAESPVADFAFFDPAQEKYQVVTTQPVAVQAEASGEAIASSDEPVASAASPTPGQEESSKWLGDARTRTFEPLLKKPAFWAINGLAVGVAVIAIAMALVRRANAGPGAQRKTLARRRDDALRHVVAAGDAEFYGRAVEAMSCQAKLEGFTDVAGWLRTRQKHDDILHLAVERADQNKFSGGLAVVVDPDERKRVLAALKEECR